MYNQSKVTWQFSNVKMPIRAWLPQILVGHSNNYTMLVLIGRNNYCKHINTSGLLTDPEM